MRHILRYIIYVLFVLGSLSGLSTAQVIDIEDFGTGSYPGAELPAGQTTYIYNPVAQPANFPTILEDGEYVIATNSQQGFVNWASIGDNTTGSGYMMLVNADDNQAGEFYRGQVPLTANTSYDLLTYLVNVNSQGDFDFCTSPAGGGALILPNVTMQIEDTDGNILTSLDTGDIPFNAVPVWDEYQLSFTTPASTSTVEIVLINNSIGGCGNDLAIDDITFRVAITMEAFDDTVTVTDTTSAQTAVLLLGANDTLDGNPLPGTENYTVTPLSSLPSGITLDGNTGEVGIAAGTPQGTYTFEYQVCETSNMFNCDTATATIIVDFPPAVITADNDSGTVADSSVGVPVVLSVLDNDTIDGISSPTDFELSISAGSSLPSGLTFDESTGDVGVLVGTPTGIYTFNYDLCELGDPTNCETATVTIDVTNPGGAAFCPIGTSAFPGTYFVVSATNHPGQNQNAERTVGQPLLEGTNETGANSAITFFGAITMDLTGDAEILVPEGEVIEISLSSSFGTQGRAEILMSADGVTYTSLGTTGQGGSVYGAFSSNIMRYDDFTVPAGGARFLQVDHQNQGVRADGVIYGTQCQPGGPPTVQAVDDSGSVADSSIGTTSVLNVIDNDSIDGINPPTDFDLTIALGSALPAVLSFDTATGEVSVLQNAPTGTYSFDYEVCEQGSTNNCQIATVTIDVTNPGGAAFCPIGTSAFPGTYFVVSASGGQNPGRAVGMPLAEGSTETGANSAITFFPTITMDLTGDTGILVPEGEVIEVSLSSSFGTQARAEILMSADGVTYTSLGTTGQGGSVYGAFSSNIMRYDDFTVPAGGARFLQVDHQNQGVRADGVIYGTQCQPSVTPTTTLTASKSIETYDPNNIGLYSIPGNDVIYTISVENTGTQNIDDGSMLLIDILPAELSFYNADINDGFGPETVPVIFTDNGTDLTFNFTTDVGFSQSATAPTTFSACNYTPVPNSYDPLTTYICFNPKGEMLPNSDWAVSFRMRIE